MKRVRFAEAGEGAVAFFSSLLAEPVHTAVKGLLQGVENLSAFAVLLVQALALPAFASPAVRFSNRC